MQVLNAKLFHLAFHFDEQEIIPWVQGEFRFDKADNPVKKFSSPETEIRAAVEGQFIAKRAHAEDLGFSIGNLIYFLCGDCKGTLVVE